MDKKKIFSNKSKHQDQELVDRVYKILHLNEEIAEFVMAEVNGTSPIVEFIAIVDFTRLVGVNQVADALLITYAYDYFKEILDVISSKPELFRQHYAIRAESWKNKGYSDNITLDEVIPLARLIMVSIFVTNKSKNHA